MAVPVKTKYTSYRGITFKEAVYIHDNLSQPVEMDGWVGRMQVRSDYGTAVVLDLTTANGGLTIERNRIVIVATDDQTAALTVGAYKFDLEVESPDGTVLPLVYGSFKVKDWITQ